MSVAPPPLPYCDSVSRKEPVVCTVTNSVTHHCVLPHFLAVTPFCVPAWIILVLFPLHWITLCMCMCMHVCMCACMCCSMHISFMYIEHTHTHIHSGQPQHQQVYIPQHPSRIQQDFQQGTLEPQQVQPLVCTVWYRSQLGGGMPPSLAILNY